MPKADIKVLQIRFSLKDYEKISEDAKASGLTISEHARQILLSEKGMSLLQEEMQKWQKSQEAAMVEKYNENIQKKCDQFLLETIKSMSIFSFLGMRSFINKSKKNKGVEFQKLTYSPRE